MLCRCTLRVTRSGIDGDYGERNGQTNVEAKVEGEMTGGKGYILAMVAQTTSASWHIAPNNAGARMASSIIAQACACWPALAWRAGSSVWRHRARAIYQQ